MGLRSRLLEIPIVYDALQSSVYRKWSSDWIVTQLINASAGMRVLDVGCGTGNIVNEIPAVTYVGIDHNQDYIDKATRKHGSLGRFLALDVNDAAFREIGQFDRVLLLAVLHHLSDDECLTLLPKLQHVLAPDGLLITLDPAIDEDQHPIAALLARIDRGRYSRSAVGYRDLIERSFGIESGVVRHDLLRVPYTMAAFRARRLDFVQSPPKRVE